MNKVFFITILSFLLDIILSIFIPINTNFFNYFFVISSLIIISELIEDKTVYYFFVSLISIIYDLFFTSRVGFNLIVFLLCSIFIKNYNIYFKSKNKIMKYISFFILYRLISYFILILTNYYSFNIFSLLKSIYSSILLNLIYVMLINKIFLQHHK